MQAGNNLYMLLDAALQIDANPVAVPLRRRRWTPQEDDMLKVGVQTYQHDWALIKQNCFPVDWPRTVKAMEMRYHKIKHTF
ncbi:hypothetical protein V6N12_075619 [Hibiscus sabdariffa]|uniref:Myb-like domain-containing protein n=1 Tax=Hibiscus sabdariffa TaxID=183260 RepID=A0ABR2C847_9ROSI